MAVALLVVVTHPNKGVEGNWRFDGWRSGVWNLSQPLEKFIRKCDIGASINTLNMLALVTKAGVRAALLVRAELVSAVRIAARQELAHQVRVGRHFLSAQLLHIDEDSEQDTPIFCRLLDTHISHHNKSTTLVRDLSRNEKRNSHDLVHVR